MNENLPLADIADVAEKLADSAKLTSHLELTEEQKQKLTGLTGSYKNNDDDAQNSSENEPLCSVLYNS